LRAGTATGVNTRLVTEAKVAARLIAAQLSELILVCCLIEQTDIGAAEEETDQLRVMLPRHFVDECGDEFEHISCVENDTRALTHHEFFVRTAGEIAICADIGNLD
jgi:hypothetical protein